MATPADSKPLSIAIIGGGISGLTLLLSLLHHSPRNIRPTVYEAAPTFSEIGAGVSLGSNAQKAMKLLHPAIFAAFEKCTTDNKHQSKKNTWFTCRVGDARRGDAQGLLQEEVGEGKKRKVGEALFDINHRDGEYSGGVYRAAFLDELVKSLPEGHAQFGKRLVNITDATDGSGDKVCHFADGTTAQHSAVIGCDGIKSMTRKIVLGANDPATTPVFSGKYAYRGLIPMDQAIELLGEEEAANSQMYYGYHGHVLTFPIAKGTIMNVVAFSSKNEWTDANWVVRTSKSDMLSDFAQWGPQVQKIINAMQNPDIWALFYHLPAHTFHTSSICLLGDAAHATTPHQGAGAGMCLEDVVVLSHLMAEVKDKCDLERAFQAFDEVRRPRGCRNVEASKEAGMLYDFELPGVRDDLIALEQNLKERMRWVWEWDIQADIAKAQSLLRNSRQSHL